MSGLIPARGKARNTFRSFGAKGDGVADDTAAIQKALQSGAPVFGQAGDEYRITATLVPPAGAEVDWCGAGVLDDVREYWPQSEGGRAAPLVEIYGVQGVTWKNMNYRAAPARATVGTPEVPTAVFWLGDNRKDVYVPTRDIKIEGIKAKDCVPGTLFVSIAGDIGNVLVDTVDIDGNCTYGINVEYGLAASEASKEGAHPFNIDIVRFNGKNNATSEGFLRTASCYNVRFRDCEGVNVKSFIYAWAGDRGINRVSQSVTFDNVVHRVVGDFLPGVINYVVQILAIEKDGSTDEPLPAWTNFDHLFTFNNVQLQNNKVEFSTGVRFYGSLGTTVFNGGVIQGTHTGVLAQPSVSYRVQHALEFNGTVFKNNTRDIVINEMDGVELEYTKHKDGDGLGVPVTVMGGAAYTKIHRAKFSGLRADREYIVVEAGCEGTIIEQNKFDVVGASQPITLNAPARGYGNEYGTYNGGQFLTKQGWACYGLSGQAETMAINMVEVPGAPAALALDALKRTAYEAQVGNFVRSVDRIKGGRVGDEVIVQSMTPYGVITFENQKNGVPVMERIITSSLADQERRGIFTVRLKLSSLGWVLA